MRERHGERETDTERETSKWEKKTGKRGEKDKREGRQTNGNENRQTGRKTDKRDGRLTNRKED